MNEWNIVKPTESNHYCLFAAELEDDPLVFFHITKQRHKDSIISEGFKSAAELGIGEIQAVSYAKKSSDCLNHIGWRFIEDYVVFAVRFDSTKQVVDNPTDIHVYDPKNQPNILCYRELKAGFRVD